MMNPSAGLIREQLGGGVLLTIADCDIQITAVRDLPTSSAKEFERKCKKVPICVYLDFVAIVGHVVCIYSTTGELTYSPVVEAWLQHTFQAARCEESDFKLCLKSLEKLNEKLR